MGRPDGANGPAFLHAHEKEPKLPSRKLKRPASRQGAGKCSEEAWGKLVQPCHGAVTPPLRSPLAAGPPSNPKQKIRPPVPAKEEKPTMGLTSNKNFITANAVDVILAKPGKVPQPEFQWTQKPDYGKVPMYLKRNKDRVAKEKEHFTQYLRMREAPVRAGAGG